MLVGVANHQIDHDIMQEDNAIEHSMSPIAQLKFGRSDNKMFGDMILGAIGFFEC